MTDVQIFSRNGRHISDDERQSILMEIRTSRTPISTIAAKYNVSRPTIYSWMKKYPGPSTPAAASMAHVASEHIEPSTRSTESEALNPQLVRIRTPNGYMIEFDSHADAEMISRLLDRITN